jgi:hypothetical protein
VRFDWRSRLNLGIEEFWAGRISWNEAWDYVSELMRDQSSHTFSAIQGDKYVPSSAERAAYAVHERWLSAKAGKSIRVIRPWAGKKPTYRKTPNGLASDAASVERRKKLADLF